MYRNESLIFIRTLKILKSTFAKTKRKGKLKFYIKSLIYLILNHLFMQKKHKHEMMMMLKIIFAAV